MHLGLKPHLDHEDRVSGHEPCVHDLPPGNALLDHRVHLRGQRQQILHPLRTHQHKGQMPGSNIILGKQSQCLRR